MSAGAKRAVRYSGLVAVVLVVSLLTANSALATTGRGARRRRTVESASGCVLSWPFATKAPSQYRRVDQGWDLQSRAGQPVRAVGAGVLGLAHDPGGFGDSYLFEVLDAPLAGAPSDTIYYGHATLNRRGAGTHVAAGETVAETNTANHQNGSNGPAGWLEIGFARHGSGSPVDHGTGRTRAGSAMRPLLIRAPVTCSPSSLVPQLRVTERVTNGQACVARLYECVMLGDWTGSGVRHPATVDVVKGRLVWHECLDANCSTNRTVYFGLARDRVVVGDWTGSKVQRPATVRGAAGRLVWHECLDASCSTNRTVYFGLARDRVVVGDWTGSDLQRPGTVRGTEGALVWNECLTATCSTARTVHFGTSTGHAVAPIGS